MNALQLPIICSPRYAFIVLLFLVFTTFAFAAQGQSNDTGAASSPINNPSPGAELWRAVRSAQEGKSQVQGLESAVLINTAGDEWRHFRNNILIKNSGWALGISVLVIVIFFLLRGRIKLEEGRSGKTVTRWTLFERTLHWFTATLFVILSITGLVVMFGRRVLIPVVGGENIHPFANLSKLLHNYLGPVFSVGILLMIIFWIRHNLPAKYDFNWLLKGGGVLTKGHPSAGRMNAGEKIWFWFICSVGLLSIVTGYILDFPNFEQTRETLQLVSILHSIGSIAWICLFLGHAYIATLGTEGALEGMTKGEVDVNWAKQHHDLWLEKVQQEASTVEKRETGAAGDTPAKQPAT